MLPLLLALLLAAPGATSARDDKPAGPQESRLAARQAARLAEARSRFEQLKSDARRRKYREGWESLLRELDAAARIAPRGPRSAEVALTAAQVRAELFVASRSPADARAAFAALRKVDEDHPGPIGLQALYTAVQLSWRTKSAGDRAAAARRLVERYPESAEAKAVAARTAELSGESAPRPTQAALEAAVARAAQAAKQEARPAAPADAPATPELKPAVVAERAVSVEGASSDSQRLAAEKEEPARMVATARPAPAPVSARPKIEEAADEGDDDDDAGPPEPEAVEAPPSKTGPIVRAVKNAVAALTAPDDAPASAAKARELRGAALSSNSSLASQLGLKVRRIVVDAGHGGHDTGAIGPHGVREKDMALAIARKVTARLKSLGFTVIMTRRDDTFVPLDERTRIANESRADLFVSIHCNAARRRKLEGVETWTLNVAADRYAARLAAFENAEADHNVSDLRMILADLATKANASDARDLAESVQSSLVRTLRSRAMPVRDHGTKQALFYVLLGTHMPSILVETGFISNPSEEARLKSARFQEGTAEAIARGVKEYVESRRQLASVP
jgi:N-acetylmuramoyl-L-alanine amidase